MQLTKSTIEKFGDVLIRLGEASVIGAAATFFVKEFPFWQSLLGLITGGSSIILGLYVNNSAENKGA
jgi:hypothetical protein